MSTKWRKQIKKARIDLKSRNLTGREHASHPDNWQKGGITLNKSINLVRQDGYKGVHRRGWRQWEYSDSV